MGVTDGQARSVAEHLRMIGKEVRGPEDMPVLQEMMFRR